MALCSDVVSDEGKGTIPQLASWIIRDRLMVDRAKLWDPNDICIPVKPCNLSNGIVWLCRCRKQRCFVWELEGLAVSS